MMDAGPHWTLLCLLLLGQGTTGLSQTLQCRISPVGALHPVQAQLERWGAGPGCAARETGTKETHVVAVGRATHSPDRQVTVLLRPLFPSRPFPPGRVVVLVLASQRPIHWWLHGQRLPQNMHMLVQVSPNSTVQSHSVPIKVQMLPSLPFRPRPLLRWALHRHGNLSSLTHTSQANRVYLRLGEDPTMPSVCKVQSLFLSHNYLTSDLWNQEVRGCLPSAGTSQPEVHVIRLLSAGSGLCGSLQVEVPVSLVTPVANAGWCRLVLILSSAAPVNWALSVTGLQGHIFVYSSNTVSPLYPEEAGLTLTTKLTPDLSITSDLLAWANHTGFPAVTSYTEADLANRFVIRVVGGTTDESGWRRGPRLPWVQERHLRQWLAGGRAGGGREAVSVHCQDGRLNVAVDRHILQTLSPLVGVVTLRDPQCQASSNGSHFLLAFPVISCGTEGLIESKPRGVTYRNKLLLWRHQLSSRHNQTEERTPLVIQFSCFTMSPSPSSRPGPSSSPSSLPREPPGPVTEQGPEPLPKPRTRSGPQLSLQLFVSESYDQRQIRPCTIIADHRVYVEVTAQGGGGGVEVRSCVVSPLSYSWVSPSWKVITDGCSSDTSLKLSTLEEKQEEEEEEKGEGEEEEEKRVDEEEKEVDDSGEDRLFSTPGGMRKSRRKEREGDVGGEEQTNRLRFSFILRPIYNNSVQFLHCSLRVCSLHSDQQGASPTTTTSQEGCQGALVIPALSPAQTNQQCESRHLYRPMLVTWPQGGGRAPVPPAGQRAQAASRPSVSQLVKPSPAHNSKGHEPAGYITGVDTGPVLGIVFAAFLMGIGLTGALWWIYTHTGSPPPIRQGSLLDTAEPNRVTWNSAVLLEQSREEFLQQI